jgi:hypothetical protein
MTPRLAPSAGAFLEHAFTTAFTLSRVAAFGRFCSKNAVVKRQKSNIYIYIYNMCRRVWQILTL